MYKSTTTQSPADKGGQRMQQSNSQRLRTIERASPRELMSHRIRCQLNFHSKWKDPKGFDIYIPSFYRDTRHSLKAHIYFWMKGKIRLTMKIGWKLCIRQKHKLIFGMRLNTCWPHLLFRICIFGKKRREVKINHLVWGMRLRLLLLLLKDFICFFQVIFTPNERLKPTTLRSRVSCLTDWASQAPLTSVGLKPPEPC